MTAEIVNLRRGRKARQRQDAEIKASENRAKFGRTKAERVQKDAETKRTDRHFDALRREPGIPGTEQSET
jgi:hypothetical protein